eukprot:m.111239 g.111239  ORF g.111239 m.111239 type:complete len:1221 (-) comp9365_c0_seq4:1045-4707(-)
MSARRNRPRRGNGRSERPPRSGESDESPQTAPAAEDPPEDPEEVAAREAAQKAAAEQAAAEQAAAAEEAHKAAAAELEREAQARIAAQRASRTANLAANESRPDEAFFRKLDSSVKKNSALVKKLRTNINEAQQTALLNDIQKCNLTKYIPEVVASLASLPRTKRVDIATATAVASLVHQRYADFADQYKDALSEILATPLSADKEVLPLFRVGLRMHADLIIHGVFPMAAGRPLLKCLQEMSSSDHFEQFLSVVVSLCKHCSLELTGILPTKYRIASEKFGIKVEPIEVFPNKSQEAFASVLVAHFDKACALLLTSHKALQQRRHKNEATLQLKGELSQEREEAMETAQKAYDKLLTNCSALAELLDKPMPELPEDKPEEALAKMRIDISNPYKNADHDGVNGVWEDEETRKFYQSVTDLRVHLPRALFDIKDDDASKKEDAAEDDAQTGGDGDPNESLGTVGEAEGGNEAGEADEAEYEEEDDGDAANESTITDAPATTAADLEGFIDDISSLEQQDDANVQSDPMTLFINQLPNCINRNKVDEFAKEFCSLNSKGNRRRLAYALFKCPRNRVDLLPYYSRLVATLHHGMPDLAEQLVDMLRGEFRFFIKKMPQSNRDGKLKNVRFIAELTKFQVCPTKTTLWYLETLVHKFMHDNIDMACALLEGCGRFLYRSGDTHVRTKLLLEAISRLKTSKHFNERHSMLIANALYYSNPPENKKVTRKVRPPLHEFIRFLLYKYLAEDTLKDVLRKLRKCPWSDEVFVKYLESCFVRIWKVKEANLSLAASLLAGLSLVHDDVVVRIVDGVLEDIRLNMEMNRAEFSQRRISTARFLGELYNFELVKTTVVFNTMYSFIRFGTGSQLDPPDNYFRIKLVCAVLDTCGEFFCKGKDNRKRLEAFLTYFQRYLWSKIQPLPVDTSITLHDTLKQLKFDVELVGSAEEAEQAVRDLEAAYESQLRTVGIVADAAPGINDSMQGDSSEEEDEVDGEAEDEDDDDAEEEDTAPVAEEASSDSSSSDDDDDDEEEDDDEDEDDDDDDDDDDEEVEETDEEEEQIKLLSQRPVGDEPEDKDFVEEFDKLMASSLSTRQLQPTKVTSLDVAIPMHLKNHPPRTIGDGQKQRVVFTLLTKKGNKQTHQEIDVPVGDGLAKRMLERQRQEAEERAMNKQLVMQLEQRAQQEDIEEAIAGAERRLPHDRARARPKGRGGKQQPYRGTGPVFEPR